MTIYDVFNGDADGITALIQLRLAEPKDSQLITGVKRDISLLKNIRAQAGDQITVLDISLDKNHAAAESALAQGAHIFYVDHHAASNMIDHPNFNAAINPAPDVCTSLLVNGHLQGAYPLWAIVGAFGDNLKNSAQVLAKQAAQHFGSAATNTLELLEELGILVNYNAYGLSEDDLFYKPHELYASMARFTSPFDFIQHEPEVFEQLRAGYAQDMQQAMHTSEHYADASVAVFVLENAAWARRVNGVFGNHLCNQYPHRAHAVLVQKDPETFMVSVRAPLNNKRGAGSFCGQFSSGGGREAAAGINSLAATDIDEFTQGFASFYKNLSK